MVIAGNFENIFDDKEFQGRKTQLNIFDDISTHTSEEN